MPGIVPAITIWERNWFAATSLFRVHEEEVYPSDTDAKPVLRSAMLKINLDYIEIANGKRWRGSTIPH